MFVVQSLQGLTGTPLVAGSPIRHESAVQGSAVEVQTYQPPWKALSEFALQSDLDQPAFQQLVSPMLPVRTVCVWGGGVAVVVISQLSKVGPCVSGGRKRVSWAIDWERLLAIGVVPATKTQVRLLSKPYFPELKCL